MPATERVSNFKIKIAGAELSEEQQNRIESVEIDLSIDLPGMFVIDLFDPALDDLNADKYKIGDAISIGMEVDRSEGDTSQGALITGEITAVEPIFDAMGPTVVRLRGYDKSHRLHRIQKSRTFTQSTDSEIVKMLASEAGLGVEADSTSVTHEHVYQFNQTDFDFIRERARRVGFVFFAKDDKLIFKKPGTVGTDGPELAAGDQLQRFLPRLSSAGQHTTVQVRGWDRMEKRAIEGSAGSPTFNYRAGSQKNGGSTARAFQASELIVHGFPVTTTSEATTIAHSLLDEREASFLQGEGTCRGDPAIKPGVRLKLTGLGASFTGKYFVTRATHRYSRNGYTTEIAVAGLRGDGLADILGGGHPGPIERAQRFPGVLPAIVTNNQDPEKQGRVKLKYPSISDQEESNWVPIAQPLAGPNKGFWLIPSVNDEVLVAFEHGEFNRPYVIGSLWNGKDAPPPDGKNASKAEEVHELLTAKGHKLLLDDSSGKEAIELLTKAGMKVRLDETKKSIEVSEPGGIKMTIDGTAKSMTLEGATAVNVKSSGTMKIESSGTVDMSGSGPVTIKGAVVNIN